MKRVRVKLLRLHHRRWADFVQRAVAITQEKRPQDDSTD